MTGGFLCHVIVSEFRDAVGAGADFKEKLASLKSWWPLVISGGIILGGIYGGIFTPTEASAVAAFVSGLGLTRINW